MNIPPRTRRPTFAAVILGAMLAFSAADARATTIDLGTSGQAANWLISGGGAVGVAGFQIGTGISLTSNVLSTGTFLAGGSLAQFTGAWIAQDSFFLPSDAVNISLIYSNLYGDDRVVLELNGAIIGDTNVFQVTGPGLMSFSPGGPDVAYSFDNTTSASIAGGFNPGGQNVLTLIVDNTGLGAAGGATTPITTIDGTSASLVASVTYAQATQSDTPVSEPASMTMLFSGIAGLGVLRLSRPPRAWRSRPA